MLLPTESVGVPNFGPGVFDLALRCPARASIALMGRRPEPPANVADPAARLRPAKHTGGGWMAVTTLLGCLARAGPTSMWVEGTHSAQDLTVLAQQSFIDVPRPVRDFAVETVERLLAAQAATGVAMDFKPGFVARDFLGGRVHAGGTFAFAGATGTQIWRVTLGADRLDDVREGWALTAAYALNGGIDDADHREGTVEVFEMSASDGSTVPLGTWTSDSVDPDFETAVRPRLRDMAYDLTVVPGSHCGACTFVATCPAVHQARNLLPGVPRQPMVTPVTASALKSYDTCPARFELLSVQSLPRVGGGGTAAMELGRIVDDWLTTVHHERRTDSAPCTDQDLARLGDDCPEAAGKLAEQHLAVCPMADPDIDGFVTQHTHVVLDVDTQVLLVARPDSEYELGGNVVWRETKTRQVVRPRDPYELMQADLSAAVYLTVLQAAAGPSASLEWEELSIAGAEVTVLPCDDTDLVIFARSAVAGAVADVLRDETRTARPGPWCHNCAAARWCPSAL